MSSGSWQHVEDTWSVLDFRAAPFRRLATCHSSPVSDIYVNSPVNHSASLCTQKCENNMCFVNTFLIQVLRWVGESASGTIFSVTHEFPLPELCRWCGVAWHGIWYGKNGDTYWPNVWYCIWVLILRWTIIQNRSNLFSSCRNSGHLWFEIMSWQKP